MMASLRATICLAVLLAWAAHLNAFIISECSGKCTQLRPRMQIFSTFESSTTGESEASPSQPSLPNLAERRPLKTALLALAARTARGELATEAERLQGLDLVTRLEAYNPIPFPATDALVCGAWELVWSSTYLFKSSPFFLAARAVCTTSQQAEQFNLFCRLHREALAFTQIGKVTQRITPGLIVSEFATTGAMVPGLPVAVKGTIQSTAEIVERSEFTWTLLMDRVRIKENTSNVPVLRGFLNGFAGLDSRALSSALEAAVGLQAPRPVVYHSYVDTHMRVMRDQDDAVFVFNRIDG